MNCFSESNIRHDGPLRKMRGRKPGLRLVAVPKGYQPKEPTTTGIPALRFGEWLLGKLYERKVSQSELARQMGRSREHVRQVIAGERGVTRNFAERVAAALSIPEDVALEKAGFLGERALVENTGPESELVGMFRELSEIDQQLVLALVRDFYRFRHK